MKNIIFVVTLALLAVLIGMFIFGVVTDREAFAPVNTADISGNPASPPGTEGQPASTAKATPPGVSAGSDAPEDSPPAQATDSYTGGLQTISFPSSGVVITVSVDSERYDDETGSYIFVDKTVVNNHVWLEFTFLDPLQGSADELAPGFLTQYMEDANDNEDSGPTPIGSSGIIGHFVRATDGSLTYIAWLVDVPGGVVPIVISFYNDEQYGSLMKMLDTLQLSNENN